MSAGYYTTRVSSPGWKNIDKSIPVSYSRGTVKNNGVVVPYAQVIITGENFNGYYSVYADVNGAYSVPYKGTNDARFMVSVFNHANGIEVSHIKILTQVSISSITVLDIQVIDKEAKEEVV